MSRDVLRNTTGHHESFCFRGLEDERGQLIPMVLAVMVIIAIITSAFVMNLVVSQQLGGLRYRVLAARYLAEAALERALWALESGSEDPAYVEGSLDLATGTGALQPGRFRVETMRDEGDGRFSILASGEYGGVRRAIRARVQLSPRILTYALFAQLARFEGSNSRTYLIPAPLSAERGEGGNLGVNAEVRFMTRGITVNDFSGATLSLRDGDQPDTTLLGPAAQPAEQRGTQIGKFVLAGDAVMTFGADRKPLPDPQVLDAYGVRVGMAVVSIHEPESFPLVDRSRLRKLAEANAENTELNQAVGSRAGAPLRDKRDSAYEPADFIRILEYLVEHPSTPLSGPIYVTGPVVVPGGSSLRILDGFLAVEGSLTVQADARVDVRHAPNAARFPGILTIGETHPLVVQRGGVLVVDGLVYAGGIFDAGERSYVDIKGALVAAGPSLSLRNHDATIVIRYNPSVLSTIGIQPQRGPGKTVARIVSWEEVR